ncbi:NAD(P)H-flavin reductase/hemoglobin-like flavoprotein [Streptomyces sp. LBL]|uniref:globin domain-containing protein n=1 Tax=Streptomyces sp. LBL TaxID=2940562 RepID=UPI002474A6AA|nr:globin domain-containing protein [Streptomyces sp. LBL]MDH6625086.1 NAD(P)H-flavin reductase/hemoglobin-like flavoprotein [Streptomyces sp. LBL]
MDAPTTMSADNGTSGGGAGWFTPRKQPPTTPGSAPEATEGSRLAGMRPMGRTPTGTTPSPKAPTPPDRTDETQRPPSTTDETQRPPSTTDETQRPPSTTGDILSPAPTTDDIARPTTVGSPAPTETAPLQFSGLQQPVGTQPSGTQTVGLQDAAIQAPEISSPGRATVPASRKAPPSETLLAETPRAEAPPTEAPPAEVPRVDQRVPDQRSAPSPEASPDAVLIRRTMAEISPVADKVTSYFYALLFVRHPDLRPLFPAAMDTQRDRLLKALLTAAEHIDNTEILVDYLQNLGRGHRKYGTRAEHYPAVGECLIGALSKYSSGWDTEMEGAWVRAYTTISQVMIDAAAADELRAPAWWYAEVVSHDLRTPDVAVVTVRPDQPYPFLAGQYTSVETPWWPRIWRHYSFASAPRSDGLLSFHVKAVPAGWVSNALVHRARPGDSIRLGPPAGSMTVDHTSDSGLLCLGGGTGIAPIKALVEDVAEHGTRRPVDVFYGARTDHDLYDINTMLRLQQSHPWLSVRAVVDQQAHLQLPDAIREYGPWGEYDAYLSGPPGMIRSGLDALRDIGIPFERIRHDSLEELVAASS